MPRPIRARESYSRDRLHLLNLEIALGQDERLTNEDKQEALMLIRKLNQLFVKVDGRLPPRPTPPKQKKATA